MRCHARGDPAGERAAGRGLSTVETQVGATVGRWGRPGRLGARARRAASHSASAEAQRVGAPVRFRAREKRRSRPGSEGPARSFVRGFVPGQRPRAAPSTPADGLHLTTKNRTPSRISPPRALAGPVPAQGRPGFSPRGWHRPPWRAQGQRLVIPPWPRRCARCPASYLHLQTSALASRSRVARSVAARPLVRTRCRRCTRSGCERRCVCTARIGTGSRRADLRALQGGAGRVCWLTALLRQLRSWLSARPPR